MRVAALYDIHGNLPALEAVLAEVVAEGVDEVVVGGDVVPGPMPEECLNALDALPMPVWYIPGNGERDVLEVSRGAVPTRVPPAFLPVVRWSAERLPTATLDTLGDWPFTLVLDIDGVGSVLFCHATPRDDNEIFTRVTPEDAVLPAFHGVAARWVVCGHTHMQFRRRVGALEVVNAGSVGLPFGETGAHWALLTPEGVVLRNTGYDLEGAVTRIQATGYPGGMELRAPPSEATMLELFEAGAQRGARVDADDRP